jgi:hypothetical protein
VSITDTGCTTIPRTAAALLVASAIAAALTLGVGCSAPYPEYRANAGNLTSQQVDQLAKTSDLSAVRSMTTTDAPTARQEALSRLRAQGPDGARAATLLTAGFPARTAAVPVLVERAKVDGRDALVVVEAWGSAGSTLEHTRLWVFDWQTGGVLRANSYR